ncbi:Superoxide-generating NADPH oxidase heavy chain subunit A [Colletotrichum sp. SAR 10_71]|nr:Superoxide-generating NADPH oxidase heavy chain subunit A [Colletotrichum sp. SAR 10_71]
MKTSLANAFAVTGGVTLTLGVAYLIVLAHQRNREAQSQAYRAAFGWGVVLAKTCAGMLYPTFFFLILSMSRYFSTFLRRSYCVSRFVNWDLGQAFHVKISIVALTLATLHGVESGFPAFGVGSEILALTMEYAFDYLDAPAQRVTEK